MALACLFDRRQVGLRDCPSGLILSAARQKVCQPIGRLVGQCPPCVHEGVTIVWHRRGSERSGASADHSVAPHSPSIIKYKACRLPVFWSGFSSPPEQVTLQANTEACGTCLMLVDFVII